MLCSLERGKSAGQSANESWPLNELLSAHNVSIHKHNSLVCGLLKHVCSSPALTNNQPVTQGVTKLHPSLSRFKHFPSAHDRDHISKPAVSICVYSLAYCVQQSTHCPDRPQETGAGSLSLPTRGRQIYQHIWEENNTNFSKQTKVSTVEMF